MPAEVPRTRRCQRTAPHSAASDGRGWHRGPSSPGSRSSRARAARRRPRSSGPVWGSTARRWCERGRGRCWCRRRRRRARTRTPAPLAPCTRRSPAVRAAHRGRRATGRHGVRRPVRRRRPEVARSAGIAQALPQPQDVGERRRCAVGRLRIGSQECPPLGDHPVGLCLLEHDLGDEDRPRVTYRPPWQIPELA